MFLNKTISAFDSKNTRYELHKIDLKQIVQGLKSSIEFKYCTCIVYFHLCSEQLILNAVCNSTKSFYEVAIFLVDKDVFFQTISYS